MREGNVRHYLVVAAIVLFLLLPLIGTMLYALATNWQTTILPESYTLDWFIKLFADPRFLPSLCRSCLVSSISILVNLAAMIPAIFIVHVYLPRWDRLLQAVITIPFAIPGVILAVGLISIYAKEPVAIAGTIWILIGAYFVVILPFMYWAIKNSLNAINAVVLLEAAETMGAPAWKAFFMVILPNILKGVTHAATISFSILLGEFVIANILAGGSYETVQVFLYGRMKESGHLSSAIVVVYYLLIFIVSAVLILLGGLWNKRPET